MSLEFAGYAVQATLNGNVIGHGVSHAGPDCSVSNAIASAMQTKEAQVALASVTGHEWQTTVTVQFVVSVDTRMPSGY